MGGTLEIGKWVVCGSIYGKIKCMQDFLNKKSDILVATSVVEVGVNVQR
jgi:RecG-like helicase